MTRSARACRSWTVAALLAAALTTGLTACSSTPTHTASAPAPATAAAAPPAPLNGTGTRYRVDASASDARLYVFRGGRAARAGHNHVIAVTEVDGEVLLPSDAAADAVFLLRVPLALLAVDLPALREQTGGAFAGERSATDIEGTRRNLLGPRGLDADTHPLVVLRSVRIEGDWPMLVARTAITLRGVTREQDLLLQVDRDADGLRVRGEFVVRHRDFGLEPYSVLGGLLAVQDPVAVRFDLRARALREPAPPRPPGRVVQDTDGGTPQ
ncbi:MAG TPA: YceI family protein [Solimonas sp.]